MTATAAGVTPGIREACPSVPGRTLDSRSTISRESPGMPAKANSPGMCRPSWRRWRSTAASWRFKYPWYLNAVSTLARSMSRLASSISRCNWPLSTSASSRTSGCLSARAAGTRSPPGTDNARALYHRAIALESLVTAAEAVPPRVVHQAKARRRGSQPQIGVVDSKQQPVLGPRREHAVRLEAALGRQVVDHRADVARLAAEHERRSLRRRRAPR